MNAIAKIRDAEPVTVPDPLARLREPFPAHQVSKLPKPTKKQTDDVKADYTKGVRCQVCGTWHHPQVVHLDYVGHAALTDRLLDVDPLWSWEPVGFAPDGLPAFDRTGGLWIKLTVCGVTRLGYGAADGKSGGDAVKEIIGDALRNAAMRFGAALDLWHKGDLHVEDSEPGPSAADMAINLLRGCGDAGLFKEAWEKNIAGWKGVMTADELKRLGEVKAELVAKFVREADEAKAREAAAAQAREVAALPAGRPLPDGTPFDDEIPF